MQCLGHNGSIEGIFGHPRDLVTQAVQRITTALSEHSNDSSTRTKRFLLMGSEAVSHPADDPRTLFERAILWLLRNMIPPHADNEQAATYLLHDFDQTNKVEWVVVRPTNLMDEVESTGDYTLHDKPPGALSGSTVVSRANVAKCMVDLVLDAAKWDQYKFQMPVVHSAAKRSDGGESK